MKRLNMEVLAGRMGLALISALALMAAGPLTASVHASFPGANGKIVYHVNSGGSGLEIWTVNEDNTGVARLTSNTFKDEYPSVSADGTKVAFDSDRDGNLEIYVTSATSLVTQTRITNNAGFDEQPSWSPDGTKIAFDSSRDGDTNGEIYVMNADGTGVTRLTNDSGFDFGANWSPDGTKIIWQTNRAGQYDIWSMNPDGSGQTNLTSSVAGADEWPSWSPDGTKIAFNSDRDAPGSGNKEIYTMNANGSGQTRRTFAGGANFAPAWRPDGKEIAYDGRILDLTTGTTRSMTSAVGPTHFPDWQPLNRTYARPRGATPTRISLVPAYKQCTNPTTSHRDAISATSCFNPTPESSYLTVGSPDFNGLQANSQGSVLFRVDSSPPEDGTIAVSLTDVRCQGTSGGCSNGALTDYSGNLLVQTAFRVTDKNNGPIGGTSVSANGTVSDLPLSFSVPCALTASTTVGSTCSVTASIDAILGGGTAISDGKRAIWELIGFADGRIIKLLDGGSDGVATTPADNTLFAVGGLFFP